MSEWLLGQANLYDPRDFHFIVEHMSWLGLRLLVSIQLYLISLISPASITFQYSRIYLESPRHLLNINKSGDQLSLSLSLSWCCWREVRVLRVWCDSPASMLSSALQSCPNTASCLLVVLLKCWPANISIYKIDFLSATGFVLAGPSPAMFTVQIISLNIRDRLFGRIMQMTIINYSPLLVRMLSSS